MVHCTAQYLFLFIICLLTWCGSVVAVHTNAVEPDSKSNVQETDIPSILVSILARNAAPILPYFLGQFEELDYPKDRIWLLIQTDHNSDNTLNVLRSWVEDVQPLYANIDLRIDNKSLTEILDGAERSPFGYEGEQGPYDWTEARFRNVMYLKELALMRARVLDVDYLLMLDTDAILTNTRTLRELVNWQRPVVAPVLRSFYTNYSNFWAGIDSHGYYRHTDDYIPILHRQNIGCHHVAMVHTCVLIDIKDPRAHRLTFDRSKLLNGDSIPIDDLIVWGESTDQANIEMYALNTAHWGWLLDPEPNVNGVMDFEETVNTFLMDLMRDHDVMPLLYSPYAKPEHPPKQLFGLDKIYMVNLERRPERRRRMEALFDIIGLNVTHWPATDGQLIDESSLGREGIRVLPDYQDPFYKRPLKMGEIGCFLSHYRIWSDVRAQKFDRVMVIEDDVHFAKYFKYTLKIVLNELETTGLEWDLIYLGRKYMGWRWEDKEEQHSEQMLQGHQYLSTVSYSYWTIGYLLNASGARKLLDAQPLTKLVALDEYLPIMYNEQPNDNWAHAFANVEKIRAFGTWPHFIQPSHYTNQQGYITDTETSAVISDEFRSGEMTTTKEEDVLGGGLLEPVDVVGGGAGRHTEL